MAQHRPLMGRSAESPTGLFARGENLEKDPQPSEQMVILDFCPRSVAGAKRKNLDTLGEADCAVCALAAVERHEPDAVLLEVRLGDDDGFAVCSALTRRRPGLAILVVSDSDSDDRREQAARCGARGYVPKVAPP